MKARMLLLAASSLLALGSAHSAIASSSHLEAHPAKGPVEITLFTLGAHQPKPMTCRVVPPVAGDDYVTTAKNTSVTFSPLWNDTDTPDQDLWGFDQPQHGTVVQVGIDSLKYTPATNYVGSDSFTYTLGGCLQCSGSGTSAWCSEPDSTTGYVYITVTN
jgi:Big-like domain-containing protein